jgi:membrane protease YdiL (CAAX protease family)
MSSLAIQGARAEQRDSTLRPLPLWQALLYFGLPALLFRLSLYTALPALIRLGLPRFEAFIVSFTVPAAILFALAFGFCKRDGFAHSWGALKDRLRLLPMTLTDWLWVVAGIVAYLSLGGLNYTSQLLISAFPAIAPPDFFPAWLNPMTAYDLALWADYIGAPLKGNWGVALLYFVMFFFNIFGEELWWRGYILPRQEQAHGRWSWVIHGLLWWLWHLTFYPWQVFALLPICLMIPFIAQRRQNTWPAIIIHSQNGIVLVLIVAMVLGIA